MSIRYKLLILMLMLTAVTLGAFLALAVNLFKNDKIAYIFESSSSHTRSVANQVMSELKMHESLMSLYATGFDRNKNTFDNMVRSLFEKNESLLQVAVTKWDGQQFKKLGELTKSSFDQKDYQGVLPALNETQKTASQGGFAFQIVEADFNYFIYAEKINIQGDPASYFVTCVDREEGISTVLKRSPLFETYIVNGSGGVIMTSKKENAANNLSGWEFYKNLDKDNISEGVSETKSLTGEPSLASYARVGLGNLMVIAVISKKLALRAINVLLLKSGLFFVVLISLSALLAVYASKQITIRLRILDAATSELAQGNFDVHIESSSNDEVGRLSKNFGTMASKISALMKDNVDKARMEKELETAKLVQETLFPEKNSVLGPIKISGYYEPASECGGDWWYYFQLGTRVFVCIGDATGHGVPAALITSAARSAVSLIETSPGITPGSFLQLLNRAIYEASKGHIQMTFFVACIDTATNKLTYSNASHNAPFLIKRNAEAIKKKDLLPLLMDNDGFRLGQELASRYEEATIDIGPGDKIFFYTDGLTDIQDPTGQILDERGMIKSLTLAATRAKDVREMIEIIASDANTYRNKSMLADDVTFFACEYSV